MRCASTLPAGTASGGNIRALLLLALLAAVQPRANDPRIGTWTLTSAQCNINPPNLLTITPVRDGSHIVLTGATHLDFTTSNGGHPTPAPGNLGFNQIELKRAGKHQVELREERNGTLVATVRETLSPNGKELTSTTIKQGEPDVITVWDRTGGEVAKDPFAGEWTQDLTKTRMRQGLVVKVDPLPNGYVHFTGEDTYTAAFDGKPHDVQHSPNDSVTLTLTDPRTVEATYRRDDQITQRDHWVVSPDGNELTLVSTATLETDQHLTEKLTFRKQ